MVDNSLVNSYQLEPNIIRLEVPGILSCTPSKLAISCCSAIVIVLFLSEDQASRVGDIEDVSAIQI